MGWIWIWFRILFVFIYLPYQGLVLTSQLLMLAIFIVCGAEFKPLNLWLW